MLIRIVRMTFQPEKVDEFLDIFDESKSKIRSFPGCTALQLHQDYNQTNVFSTYSIWKDEQSLNAYRDSALFQSVWPKTKTLFLKSPVAISNRLLTEVAI